jgi:hypothetical protein
MRVTSAAVNGVDGSGIVSLVVAPPSVRNGWPGVDCSCGDDDRMSCAVKVDICVRPSGSIDVSAMGSAPPRMHNKEEDVRLSAPTLIGITQVIEDGGVQVRLEELPMAAEIVPAAHGVHAEEIFAVE